jgi:RNA polymerase sigma factor (sigma-70 family)
MSTASPLASTSADPELLNSIRSYLNLRELGRMPSQELEAAWKLFYEHYAGKIRVYAFACGAATDEVADCAQEVWTELLLRLPTFDLDPSRGRFDSWLFRIVQGKTAEIRRSQRRRFFQENAGALHSTIDGQPSAGRALEAKEMLALAWNQLCKTLSSCNLQVLHMRLIEQRPVSEVAEKLGLSHEQVWYRYHRARREMEQLSAAWWCEQAAQVQHDVFGKKGEKAHKSAQGDAHSSVSRSVEHSFGVPVGGSCVDYGFQRLELGRRESDPEWKVKWSCEAKPVPALYIRKMAIVAYAEICGPGELLTAHWPRIVNAAIGAGVAAGIATIIATPTAALPIFQMEFRKLLQSKGAIAAEDTLQVALLAKQQAHGPWCRCEN